MNKKHVVISQMNAVPYIDITFVLLVVFMLIPNDNIGRFDVNLPKVSVHQSVAKEVSKIHILIDKDNQLKIDMGDNRVLEINNLDRLVTRLKKIIKINPEIKVYVYANKELAYGEVMNLLSLLRKNDITSLSLMTET